MKKSNKSKSANLFNELDELLLKVGDDFGPIILEELKNRIDSTIENFNQEASKVIKSSFKKNISDYELFKKYKKTKNVSSSKSKELDDKIENIPNFIKEYESKTTKEK